jgi:hypothetical protein
MKLLSGVDFHGNDFEQTRFIYEWDPDQSERGAVPMWQIGYGTGDHRGEVDRLVIERTYRHGNYDFVTKQTIWNAGTSERRLPPSLYLAGKPAFFGSAPWPWVTPEKPERPLATLPARKRFDALH